MNKTVLRCVIYTRKSTEIGLEQDFNSLEAQREACAAFALSQRHEGWTLGQDRYDDGGYTGGDMARPALKRLLSDIEAGKLDIVLIYKIDRLTRSLIDFSKIVEVMDEAGVRFVSVTQNFNNTSSMGRLTLNILLSFAQFEREMTGERIRDKISASKKRGLWMGGPVPLGYTVKDRKLIVNEKEAQQVRHIMRRYLSLGTVPLLAKELEREGYRTKIQKRASGPHRGGCAYRRGTLYHLLSNRIYRGMIVHKGNVYPGAHDAIVGKELWESVQALRQRNACGSACRKKLSDPSLLTGKIFDGEGRPMTPSSVKGRNRNYRYYVTRPNEIYGTPAWRLNAFDLEAMVCSNMAERIYSERFARGLLASQHDEKTLRKLMQKSDLVAAQIRSGTLIIRHKLLKIIINRIDVYEGYFMILMDHGGLRSVFELDQIGPISGQSTICVPTVRVRRGHSIRLEPRNVSRSESAARELPNDLLGH